MSKLFHLLDPHENPAQYDGYDGYYEDEPEPLNNDNPLNQ